jgi:PA-IL-like protein
MVRRLISTVVLVACAGLYTLAAAERATLILTNGERRSGEATFIDGQLKLTEAGREQSIPLDQVAVIDFAGGMPSELELSRVSPHAGGQTAVMRSGHAQAGKFVSVRGDTLQWENDKGQSEQYPLRDVSRIYLRPESARTVYNNERAGRGPAASGTSGQLAGTTVRVAANQAWTDTGMTVNQGDRVAFQASGEINYGRSPGQTATPDGGAERRATYPDASVPVGALIGRVGNGAPFAIGTQSQALGMPASGRLMLGVNDNELTDNSGFYTVIVAKQ